MPLTEVVRVKEGPAGKTVLSLENLCKVYPGGISAVENISLTVGEGMMFLACTVGYQKFTLTSYFIDFSKLKGVAKIRKNVNFCF